MKLQPVSQSLRIHLRDSDARIKKGVPEKVELHAEITKQQQRIGELQRVFNAEARQALLIVLQGRDAAGKDGTIRHVFEAVDPQGCEVTSFKVPTSLELAHDYLWRVHARIPERGMIGIFNRSHYEDVLVVRVKNIVPKKVWKKRYAQINDFEEMLSENGVVILKFFLHVSRDEQKARLRDRLSDATKNWKFRAGDLDDRALWDDYTEAYKDALRKCSTSCAPWYIVPADDKGLRNLLIARVIADTLESLKPKYPRADPAVLQLKIT
ncbi:MAG TPA: polyphosphate kinase 2 family protein [Gemmatimonadaceae bacterium]|nr:polyphosphate kinase 2 family protein [Gemmatimonadaceae bacterium]